MNTRSKIQKQEYVNCAGEACPASRAVPHDLPCDAVIVDVSAHH